MRTGNILKKGELVFNFILKRIFSLFTLLVTSMLLASFGIFAQCPSAPDVGNGTVPSGGGQATLYAETASDDYTGMSHTWYYSSTGSAAVPVTEITVISTIPYITSLTKIFGTETSYWVATVQNGCESARVKVSANVSAPPPTPTIIINGDSPTSVCPVNSSFSLRSSLAGNSYQWYQDGIRINGAIGISYSPIQTGTHLYHIEVDGVPSGDFSVTVVSPIENTVRITGDVSLCYGESTTLTATINPQLINLVDYQWKINENNVGTNINNYTSNNLIAGDQIQCIATIKNTSSTCATLPVASSNVLTINKISSLPAPSTGDGTTVFGTGVASLFAETTMNDYTGISHRWYYFETGSNYVPSDELEVIGTIPFMTKLTKNFGTVETSYWVATTKDGCESSRTKVTAHIGSPPIPPVVIINGEDPNNVCSLNSSFSLKSSLLSGSTYQWYQDGNAINGATDISYFPTQPGLHLYSVQVDGVISDQVSIKVQTPADIKDITVVAPYRCQGAGSTKFNVDDNCFSDFHSWTITDAGGSTIDNTGLVTWDSDFFGEATIKFSVSMYGQILVIREIKYKVYPYPVLLPDINLTKCNWENIMLTLDGVLNANWYDANNHLKETGVQFNVGQLPQTGNYTFKAESISPYGCLAPSKITIEVTVTAICDDKLNWIESRSLDENGVLYSDSKSYFSLSGEPLQTQSRNFTSGKIFGSQPLRDRYNRSVGSTLSAPIPYSDFNYHFNFLLNQSTTPYSISDFDSNVTITNPASVDHNTPGTVGWYYSTNNNIETNVPVTAYPYTRTEFYEDGTGEVKRSASAGNEHRLGKGHEVLSGTFPVYHELDDYLTMRRNAGQVNYRDNLTSVVNSGVQSVVRDQNGKYAISITDKDGKTIMSARLGTADDKVLTVANNISSSGDPASTNDYRPMTYFYILQPQTVSITGSTDFVVEDIVNNVRKNPGQTFADANNQWPVGFYRILLNNTASAINLSYTHYLTDVSYQFYDDAGRLKTSVSPNGYAQLKKPDPVPFAAIDKTTYQYNHQGWLLSMTEPDAGTTSYKYRRDGKIRFSQNAQQLVNETSNAAGKGKFSYTNYDALGRPYESGEYIGTQTFSSTATQLNFEDQAQYATTDKKDWVRTYYDVPDADFQTTTGLPSDYVQNFVRSAVSHTTNANNHTWYSYDEMGRVTWMAQRPAGLPRIFVVKYNYDFLGNVMTIANLSYNLSGTLQEQFYHYYEYDKDKRLSKAYTSTEANGTKQLRADYQYYLHGPLKRIVLGDKLQGLDFVYNINGWLTQINHPDNTQDPGHDGASNGVKEDVFGMVLDYYESSLSGLFPTSENPMKNNDPLRIHHLPNLDNITLQEQLAGTNQQQLRNVLEGLKHFKNTTEN